MLVQNQVDVFDGIMPSYDIVVAVESSWSCANKGQGNVSSSAETINERDHLNTSDVSNSSCNMYTLRLMPLLYGICVLVRSRMVPCAQNTPKIAYPIWGKILRVLARTTYVSGSPGS